MNSRYTLAALIFAVSSFALPAISQAQIADDGKITIAAKWKQGERHRYTFTRTKINSKAAPVEVKYDVTAVVQAAHATGYTVLLRIEGLLLPEILSAIPKLRDGTNAELLKTLPLDFVIETDETGNIETLKNWQAITQKMDDLLKLLLDAMPPAALANARATLKALYADEPTTRQTALRDLDVLFTPLGDMLIPGKPLIADIRMDLPLIGEQLAKDTFLLTLDKPRAGVFFHEHTRVVDPTLFSQGVERITATSALGQSGKLRDAGAVAAMLVRDRNESEIDSQTGWLIRAHRNREVVQDSVVFETSTLKVERH